MNIRVGMAVPHLIFQAEIRVIKISFELCSDSVWERSGVLFGRHLLFIFLALVLECRHCLFSVKQNSWKVVINV